MRKFICGFLQDNLKAYGLGIKEVLILEYLYQFFQTERVYKITHNDKIFCWIANDKILSDLPILNIGKRQLIRIINKMRDVGVVEVLVKNNKKFLWVDFECLKNSELLKSDKDIIDGLSKEAEENCFDEVICSDKKTDEINKNNKKIDKNNKKISKNFKKYEKNNEDGVIFNNLNKNIAIRFAGDRLKIYYNKNLKVDDCNIILNKLKQSCFDCLTKIQYDICFKKATITKLCDGCFLIEKTSSSVLKLKIDDFIDCISTILRQRDNFK